MVSESISVGSALSVLTFWPRAQKLICGRGKWFVAPKRKGVDMPKIETTDMRRKNLFESNSIQSEMVRELTFDETLLVGGGDGVPRAKGDP